MPPNVPIPSDDIVVFTYHSLAKPKINMFDPIKRMICEDLKSQYEIYRNTDAYAGMYDFLL